MVESLLDLSLYIFFITVRLEFWICFNILIFKFSREKKLLGPILD